MIQIGQNQENRLQSSPFSILNKLCFYRDMSDWLAEVATREIEDELLEKLAEQETGVQVGLLDRILLYFL